MTIIINRTMRIAGVDYTENQSLTLGTATETDWVNKGWARWAPGSEPAQKEPLYVTRLSGEVAESVGSSTILRTAVAQVLRDPRSDRGGTAAAARVTGIANAVALDAPRVTGTIYYVSASATNGFAAGLDANSGLSKALPKLTLSGAFSAAAAGDTIIMNDGVYDSAFFSLDKSITILPYSYRGTTIRSTNASYTLYINADNITLGALVIDSNAVSASALRSPAAAAAKKNLRLYGTKLIGKTYSLYHTGTLYAYGVEIASADATRAWMRLESALAGDVLVEDLVCDANITSKPTVAGVNAVFRRCKVLSSSTIAQVALDCTGNQTLLIEDSELGVDVSTAGGSGMRVTPHATIPCDLLIVRRNRIRNGVAAAQQASGYGIGIGAESASAGVLSDVRVYFNELTHVNHGLFFGFCVAKGRSYGNVIRDAVIGLIVKGASGDVMHSHNIVVGGPLTGGALRTKGSSGAKLRNNLVIWDASSVAAGAFIQCDEATEGVSVNSDFANNILYAPSRAVPDAIIMGVGSSATFRRNNYFAGSFPSDAFAGGTQAAWGSTEPTALYVDPLFVGAGDYRLTAASPLIGAGVAHEAEFDFLGNPATGLNLGPMPVAA